MLYPLRGFWMFSWQKALEENKCNCWAACEVNCRQIPGDRISLERNPNGQIGQVSQQGICYLESLHTEWERAASKSKCIQHLGEQGDHRSLPSPTPLILRDLALNSIRFARAAWEIIPVLLVLQSASVLQRNQHSSYSAFPGKVHMRNLWGTDATDQRWRRDCWMQLLILLKLSSLSPSHWKPRCLYGPVTFVTPSLSKAFDEGVSLQQPGPDRDNLNSGFAICWVEASSVNAEWRKKTTPQRKSCSKLSSAAKLPMPASPQPPQHPQGTSS